MTDGFTQEQVNSIVSARVSEAKEAAVAKVTQEFQGKLSEHQKVVESVTKERDELKKLHDTITGEYTTKQTEWETREQEFKTLAEENTTLKSWKANLEFEKELVKGGVKGEHAEDLRILISNKGLLKDKDGKDRDIAKVLEDVKPNYPTFFADSANQPGGTATPGTPKGAKPKPYDRMEQLRNQ